MSETPAPPTPSPMKKEQAKVHSHKSVKMTSEALNDLLVSQPRSLPSIATDPFAMFRDKQKTSPFNHHSPYAMGSSISAKNSMKHLQTLSSDDKKMLDMLIAPSPPKGSVQGKKNPRKNNASVRSDTRTSNTDDESAGTTADDAGSEHGETMTSEHQLSDDEAADEKRGTSPKRDPDAPNELTLTYLKILQKSEDYNRRTIKESERKNIAHIHKNWMTFTALVHQFLELFDDVEKKQETKKRDEIIAEELTGRHKIEKQCDASHHVARRHEDIKPACPTISKGKTVHLSPELVNGMLVEFRWRGNIEAVLNILIFDEQENLCGVASATELVKGTDQAVAIRRFSEQGSGLSIGGSLVSFQVILANLTFRMKRVVFSVVNRSSAGNLENMSRGWLTLRVPPGGESLTHNTKETKEVFACHVKEGGSHCGLVIGSIVRRGTGNTWIFGCDNDAYLWANNAQRLAIHLSATYSKGLAGVEMEAATSYERLGFQCITSFWEDVNRRTIFAEFEDGLQKFKAELNDLIAKDQVAQEKARRRASMRFKTSSLDRFSDSKK